MRATEPEVKCQFGCDDEPIGLFYFPCGCMCFDDELQYLCSQHVYNAFPVNGMFEVIHWGRDSEKAPRSPCGAR